MTTPVPTKVLLGWGASERISEVVQSEGYRRVLLMTGKSSLQASGYLSKIVKQLEGCNPRVVAGVPPLPTVEYLQKLVESESANPRPDAIIGIGGGSVLDSAKCLSTLLLQRESLTTLLDRKLAMNESAVPCVAIPTTAGTGSEVTKWSTVWDFTRHKKFSLQGEWMYPKYALVDPSLTFSLPPRFTAIGGFDALAHAIESAYSTNSSDTSDAYAFQALRTIPEALALAVRDGLNKSARERMLYSSLQSGLAIAQTQTAAAHSVSYPLTIYFGVPHGHAVGLLVPEFLVFNSMVQESDCRDPRGLEYVRHKNHSIALALGYKDENETRTGLRALMNQVGLQTTLRELGVEDIDLIAREGLSSERALNQPRLVTNPQVRSILKGIYEG